MKRDHDYVSFADYEKDMRETADQAAEVIRELRRERDEARIMFWAAVRVAGGKLAIPQTALQKGMPEGWTMSDDIANNAIVYEIKARAAK